MCGKLPYYSHGYNCKIIGLLTIKSDCFRYNDDESLHFLQECSALDPRFKGLTWLASSDEKDAVFQRIMELAINEELSHESDVTNDTACSSESNPATAASAA